MDSRVKLLNKRVREYDRDLFLRRDGGGTIHLYRKKPIVFWYKWEGERLGAVVVKEQYIMSLTDNWYHEGTPVDWGTEPLLRRIREIDGWGQGDEYQEFCKRRESKERDHVRMRRNEWRALAADSRREFAKATNEFRMGGNSPI